jgi:hypothetical protein
MKIFLDTANLEELRKGADRGVRSWTCCSIILRPIEDWSSF